MHYLDATVLRRGFTTCEASVCCVDMDLCDWQSKRDDPRLVVREIETESVARTLLEWKAEGANLQVALRTAEIMLTNLIQSIVVAFFSSSQ